jgi:hypothetical protein
MKKPKKPIRKEYWAGESVENDEKRYTGGLKQYADKAEKYIEHIEKKVNGNSTSDKTALNLDFITQQRESLIDFSLWIHKLAGESDIDKVTKLVDLYLKSINDG